MLKKLQEESGKIVQKGIEKFGSVKDLEKKVVDEIL